MDPAALGWDSPVDWLRVVLGTLVFLLPGVAAVDRLLPRGNARWALAPVFSASLYPVGAILLSVVGVPVQTFTTVLLGLAWTAVFAQRRLWAWIEPRVAT